MLPRVLLAPLIGSVLPKDEAQSAALVLQADCMFCGTSNASRGKWPEAPQNSASPEPTAKILAIGISMRKTGSGSVHEFIHHASHASSGRLYYGSHAPAVLGEEGVLDPHCVRETVGSAAWKRLLLFTSLRDPADRAHSECHYSGPCAVGQPETVATYERWRGSREAYPIILNFSRVVVEPCHVAGGRYLDDYHVRRLAGRACTQRQCSIGMQCLEANDPGTCAAERPLGPTDLELAKRALEAFHLVFVTDMMDETFDWLSRCLELPAIIPQNKVGQRVGVETGDLARSPVSPDLAAWLREHNQLDYQLLDWARQRLSRLLETSGDERPEWCRINLQPAEPPKNATT